MIPTIGNKILSGVSESDYFIVELTFVLDNEIFFMPSNAAYIYNYFVDWGDGSPIQHITSATVDANHLYVNAGVYQMKIKGIHEAFTPSLLTITDVIQWGSVEFLLLGFSSCTNLLNITAIDAPVFGLDAALSSLFRFVPISNINNIENWDTSNVKTLEFAFDNTAYFNQNLNNWDLSNCINIKSIFHRASLYNQPVNNWNTSSVTAIQYCFGLSSFQNYVGDWDISNVEFGSEFFRQRTLQTIYYDDLLIKWGAQTVKAGVTLGMNNSKYTLGGLAETGRNSLIAQGWTIIDGGGI